MNNLLCSQVRLPEQLTGVFMTGDNRNLRGVQPKLKEARDGLMAEVVEAKVRQASTAPEPLPRQPEGIGRDGEG